VARTAGVTDAHLSRVVRQVNYKSPSGDLARRVALALGLPEDYFPEFREAYVIDRVKRDPKLRERLYKRLHGTA
jgi:transcriptional regulator with XRE-family HTH domain